MNISTPVKMLMNVVLLILGISIVMGQSVMAQTRLGLHVTQEELKIWRQRAVSGPYRTAGDVGSNTPGDWDRIVANKNSFMSNPSADIWDGYTKTGCVPKGDSSNEPRTQAIKIRDAAFFSLIKEDAIVRNQVLQTLKIQTARPGVDFSNGSKWCLERDKRVYDINPGFVVAHWATRLLYAYDYIRPYISSSDRQAIDTWFKNAAHYFRINGDENLASDMYSNWDAGILSAQGSVAANDCAPTYGRTHIDGNQICRLGRFFNNRRVFMTSFYAQVGIMLNDTTMKNWGKRWVQEYLKYHVYPDSSLNELERSHNKNAVLGWAYAFQTYGKVMDIVDTFARAGDTFLYEFVTSGGAGPTQGGSKSVKTPAEFYVKTTEGTWLIYNWNTSKTVGNLIDGVWYPSDYYAFDVWLAQPNIYWKDPAITSTYLNPGPKNKQGTTKNREPDFSWMGAGRSHPGKLFMFGQMEGKVWPYKAIADPTPKEPVLGEQVIDDTTFLADSRNFSTTFDRKPQNLWDGDTATEDGSAGNAGITSFYVDFDFGKVRELTYARLFGDDLGSWICNTWTLEHKTNVGDSWTQAFTDDCNGRRWFGHDLSVAVRYIRVTVFGSSGGTQARELEVYAKPSMALPTPANMRLISTSK